MGTFRLRKPTGGSALRDGDTLRAPPPLEGAAAATASASGALSTQIKLGGAAAAQASAAGALSTQIKLGGAAAAQAAAAGTLSDYVVPTPTPHARRAYQQFLRGPVLPDGYAVQFDGVNDHGVISGLTDLSGDAITIECWWQGADFESVFRQQNGANYIVFGWRAGSGTGNPTFLLSNDGLTSGLSGGSSIQDGAVHHVAMVWERNTTNGFRVLVDGVRVAQRNSTNVAIANIATAAYLGRYGPSGAEYPTGKVQELRVWTVARTDQQINDYMRVRALGNETGLKACYHTLEASGATLADATANGYTCTLVNGPTHPAYLQLLSPPLRYGTVEEYRGGVWHTPNMADFSEPQDNELGEFGIQEGGGFAVDLVSTEDMSIDMAGVGATLRHQVCELELVTRFFDAAGSMIDEVTHVRRATVKRATQKANRLTLTLADVDRQVLSAVFPFETFTVEDFPELFVDHVGRRVPQGIGTVIRVPLVWVKKTGGAHRWAGPKVLSATGTLLTVYRGDAPGRGAVVSASEYTAGTLAAAVGGFTVHTVDFPAEQVDFSGRPYVLEADYLLPGSRQPADEIARVLALYGVATDAASFVAAAAYDAASGYAVDCLYGADSGRTGNAIVEDLLRVARGWLAQKPTGEWGLIQDRPAIPIMAFDAVADQISVEEYGDEEIEKTITVEYRPRRGGSEDLEGKLSRTTAALSGEYLIKNPYIRDHAVADRLVCYHQKRLGALLRAAAVTHAVQLEAGQMITIENELTWGGARKSFIIERISRPADANRLGLREYDPEVHVYTAEALPDGATNTYGPDYSFTPPAAPTGLTVVSTSTEVDADGKVTAYALIRATPPSVNWTRLMAQVRDNGTNEVYQAQLQLASGNYEATVAGLRPNRAHSVIAWAVNSNNIDGAATSAVAFTSGNYTTAPTSTTALTAAQGTGRSVRLRWANVTDILRREYIVLRKTGAGGTYAEIWRTAATEHVDTDIVYGNTYYYKVRTVDRLGNTAADSSEVNITPAKNVGDADIPGGGVSGPSIANGSINRGRSYTGTGSASGTIGASSGITVIMDLYTFFPNFTDVNGVSWLDLNASLGATGADQGSVGIHNTSAGATSYSVGWRNFLP